MCGIAGFLTPGGFVEGTARDTLREMVSTIGHRGPDADGRWLDAECGIALGHARLSILDLSTAGAQPMASPSGRYRIVFNGEIYNHLEMREVLLAANPGLAFRGHSDTETLLAGFDHWGIAGTLARATGMFALALWDRQDRRLLLARDRFGEKPLYYGSQSATGEAALLFASELKALHAHPAFERRVDPISLARYFQRLCVPGERAIFQGIAKVAPGTIVEIDAAGHVVRTSAFWSLAEVVERGARGGFAGSDDDAVERTEELLTAAVRRQMLSDVPLGAFLSGGVDSSAIVALMQQHSGAPVKTFTIGFAESEFDESPYSLEVARHLGTDHTALQVTPRESQAVIPRLADIYDEPFADVSQIPTAIVSSLAREQITVCLSGDAGDELFAGYARYAATLRAWAMREKLPETVWKAARPLARAAETRLPSGQARRAARITRLFATDGLAEYYLASSDFARLRQPASLAAPGVPPPSFAARSELEQLCAIDAAGYLVDDILVKVDRAAMAVGLEMRVPLLDHHLAEFAFSLPPRLKNRSLADGLATKWVLRQVLYRHVPRELIERPKKGFGVPIAEWLRTSLRDWAGSYLENADPAGDGLLDARLVRQMWSEHRERREDHSALLWAVLMFCMWRERWL